MLYTTTTQFYVMLGMFFSGAWCGAVLDFKNIFFSAFLKVKVLKIIVDFIFTIISAVLFIFASIKYNFGQFRIYLIVFYLLGIFIEQLLLGKMFAKIYSFLYTFTNKIFFNLKSKYFNFLEKRKTKNERSNS